MIRALKSKLTVSLGGAVVALAGGLAVAQFGIFPYAQAASPSTSSGLMRCSLATLHGTYVSYQNGWKVGRHWRHPYVFATIYWFNGHGRAYSITSRSDNGVITSDLRVAVTYTVAPNCTGTETVTDRTGAVRHYDLFIAPSGARFTYLRTDPGTVAAAVAFAS